MELKGKRLMVVGGAGLMGSHTVDQLLNEDVEKVLIYDNFITWPGREFSERNEGS